MVKEWTDTLQDEFKNQANASIATKQAAYMKNKFAFLGLTSPVRKDLQKPFLLQKYLPHKEYLSPIVKKLWALDHREYQYFAQEFALKYAKHFETEDVKLLEYMITHKSWWDTIDFIASNLVGAYFKKYPDLQEKKIGEWLASGNMWLQRSALLFQLKYKNDLDTDLLTKCISYLLGSKEFFINKAIGWILREYAKTNPDWVKEFVSKYDKQLSNLSKREALKIMNKK